MYVYALRRLRMQGHTHEKVAAILHYNHGFTGSKQMIRKIDQIFASRTRTLWFIGVLGRRTRVLGYR